MRKVLALVVLLGCGGPGPDEDYYGLKVVNESHAEFLSSPGFHGELMQEIEIAASVAGCDPRELRGVTLLFVDGPVTCVAAPGYPAGASFTGCYRADFDLAVVRADGYSSVWYTAVAHELVHAFIGDPSHSSPDWTVLAMTKGRPG